MTTPHSPALPAPKRQNLTIQGLRGFSALCVILQHLHNMGAEAGFFHPAYAHATRVLIEAVGHFGVMLFCLISGFLIVRSLVQHDSIGEFWRLRLIRIYPVFLCLHLVMFTLGPKLRYEWMADLSPAAFAGHFLSNVLFLPGVFSLPIAQKNAWSLSYEFAFYVLSSLLYFGVRKQRSVVLRMFALVAGAAGVFTFLYFHPFAWFLAVGVALYFMDRRSLLNPQIAARMPWLGGGALALAFVAFAYSKDGWAYLFVVSLAFGLVFFATVIVEKGWFAALLRTRFFQFLGAISYSFYLIHPFVLDPLRSVFRRVGPSLHDERITFMLFGLSGLLLATAVSAVSYSLIEVWFTNRYLKRPKSSAQRLSHSA